jgi:glycine/serine hydroxymethyltransferase
MGPAELGHVAELIDLALTGSDDDRARVRGEVRDLVERFPAYPEPGA